MKSHVERLTECDAFVENNDSQGEYYFERSAIIFEYVIDYFVTGKELIISTTKCFLDIALVRSSVHSKLAAFLNIVFRSSAPSDGCLSDSTSL